LLSVKIKDLTPQPRKSLRHATGGWLVQSLLKIQDEMSATIFYYTGTGNSLWVARKVADELGDAELFSIAEYKDENKTINSEIVGLVFPVHIWGVPAPMIQFTNTLKGSNPEYVFAIAVNAGQVSNTLVQLQKIMAENRLNLSAGFEIKMPSNYNTVHLRLDFSS